MKTKILILFLLFFSFHIQSQVITSLIIKPESPTTASLVSTICHSTHNNSGCNLTNKNVNTIGYTIYIFTTHTLGMMPAICNSIDTIEIGNLAAGNYTLIYFLNDTSAPFHDIDTLHFTVTLSTNIGQTESNDFFTIYPNPGKGLFYLKFNEKLCNPAEIIVSDITSREIERNILNESSDNHTISSITSPGIYFVKIISKGKPAGVKKLVVY